MEVILLVTLVLPTIFRLTSLLLEVFLNGTGVQDIAEAISMAVEDGQLGSKNVPKGYMRTAELIGGRTKKQSFVQNIPRTAAPFG